MKQYYVYIMTNKSRTLYTGVTSDLARRVYQHKQKLIPGFTSKYNITQLVYFEVTQDIQAAISREKQIKGWLRRRKIALIESGNPEWKDLSTGWYEKENSSLDLAKQKAAHDAVLCKYRRVGQKNSFGDP